MMRDAVTVFALVTVAYFAALNLIYLAFTGIAWKSLTGHMRARAYSALDETLASPLTPPVSVLLPAYNEEAGIVDSVHSLLALRYPEHEVIVVNDGSTDATTKRLRDAFDMRSVVKAVRGTVETQPVHGSWSSPAHPNLWLIEKANGGKADALNAGLNAAHYPYVCAVDADAIIESDALLRVAKPIIDDPQVVASGGIVRIANGCRIVKGRVEQVGLPKSRLATLQVVEYFRAFLVGRVGWSRMRSLLIISGAFGLFQRSVVEAAGGWRTDTVGEDAELVTRLHRHMRDRGEPYKVEFVADPVCWTEAPEDFRSLGVQRRRWQRGLAETLWQHRSLIGRPRYGAFGLMALPYFLVFELLGPVLEIVAFAAMPASFAFGLLDVHLLVSFYVMAVGLGVLLSVAALALEEFSFRRHARHRDAWRMLAFAVVENFGYRQLVAVWRLFGLVDVCRRKTAWGAMPRRGLSRAELVNPSET